MVSVQGTRVVSAMERVRSKNLYTNTNSFTRNELRYFRLMVLKTLALIYGSLLCLKPVRVQYYRITHVHNLPLFSLYHYFVESPSFDFVWTYKNIFSEVSYLDLPQEPTGIN